jgi:hypothetical protein
MKGFHKKESGVIVCLDSNIWRYVSDHNEGDFLGSKSKKLGLKIAAAPAVLYEALRSSNPKIRNQLVGLITRRRWHRLMPEAYLESNELFDEIHRNRPQWLRRNINSDSRKQLEWDWMRKTRGAWDRARVDTVRISEYLQKLESEPLTKLRHRARQHRKTASEAGMNAESINLGKKLTIQAEGVNVEIDAWRACTYYYYSSTLAELNSTHAEWLQSRVHIKEMLAAPEWFTFWHREVNPSCLPRAWVRFAMEQLAPCLAVNDGTPCDAQIATYWVDCDYFITADKRLFRLADICKSQAPFNLAVPILLKHGKDFRSSLEVALSIASQNVKGKLPSSPQQQAK